MRYSMEIHASADDIETHLLPPGPSHVGSSMHATIRSRAAAIWSAEPLRIEPTETGCRVSVPEGMVQGVAHHGVEHRDLIVPWNDEIFVEGVRLTFLRTSSSDSGLRKWIAVLGLLSVALVITAVVTDDPTARVSSRVEPPVLLESESPCPESDEAAARHRGKQAEAGARAKEQRFAFVLAEGPEALRLLSEARACFRTAHAPEDVARVDEEYRSWAKRLNDEYSALRIRLRLSSERQRWREALGAIRAMEDLLARHAGHPYRDWLEQRRREFQRRLK